MDSNIVNLFMLKVVHFEIKYRSFFIKVLGVLNRSKNFNFFRDYSFFKKIIRYLQLNLYCEDSFLRYAKRKKVELDSYANKIERLVFRGSTADYSYYPSLDKNSFNLGLTSSDLYTCYHLYLNYRNRLESLRQIVIFMGVFVNGYSLIHTVEKHRAIAYKYYFGVPYCNNNLIKKKYERYVFNKCSKIEIDIGSKNNLGYYSKKYYSKTSANDRVKGHMRENVREPDQLLWLKKLAEQIKKDNKHLVVVFPPFRSDYRKMIPPVRTVYKKVFELNLENTQFVDLTDTSSVTDDDFGDTEHLTRRGAIKLTERLLDILNGKN